MQAYSEEKDISSMSSYELSDYVQVKIYGLLANMRKRHNLPDLLIDTYSEGVVTNVLSISEVTRESIANIVSKNKLACADYDYIENNTSVSLENTQPESLNSVIYQSYITLAEQIFSGNSESIVGNPGITHVGLGIKREGGNFRIGIFISRRFAGVDEVLKMQNGLAVIMSGYSSDMKICCVNVIPLLQKNAILVGSNKIKHSKTTQKYVLMISNINLPAISMESFKVTEIQIFCIQGLQMLYGSGPDITGVPNGAVMAHKQQVDYRNVQKSNVDYSEFNNYGTDDLISLLQSKVSQKVMTLSPLPENDSSADMSIPKRAPPKALLNRLMNRTTTSSRLKTGLSRLPTSINKPTGIPRTTNTFMGSVQKPLSVIEESTVGTSSFGGFTPMNNDVPMEMQTPADNSFGQTPIRQPQVNVSTPSWQPAVIPNDKPTFQFTQPPPQDIQMPEMRQPTFTESLPNTQMPPGSFQSPHPSILQNAPLFGSQQYQQPTFTQLLYPSLNPPQMPYAIPQPILPAQGLIPLFANFDNIPRITLQPIISTVPTQSDKSSPEFGSKGTDDRRRRSIVVKKAQGNNESMNYRTETEEFMLLNHEAKRTREDSVELYKMNKKKQEELKAKYLHEKQETNQAFIELYNSTNTYDTICKLKDENIQCHKIVLIARSSFFRDLINKKELIGRRETIVMPDWYSASAFKRIIKFFYCTTLESGLALSKYREILLIAYHLRAHYLEKLVIIEHIIPSITKDVALDLLKDTYKRKLTSENGSAWRMLEHACLNSVANNCSELIKKKHESFVKLELPLLFKIIERSLFYLVDEEQLPLLVNLAIDSGFSTDVCDLLIKLTRNYANCVYFDKQHLNLKYFLRLISPGKDLEVRLMAEEEKDEEESLLGKENASLSKLDSASIKAILEKQRPHNNHIVSGIDIRNGKVPTFHFSINLTKNTIPDTSIFSPAFNSDSRSWHLKLDVTGKGDVSYYLVERGSPVIDETNRTKFISFKDKIPLNFTTVLFEVVVKDPVLEKNSTIFFSFSHDQHQVIGHKNFFNLKQLSKKDNIELLVWIQEFPFHSAVIQYISEKFSQLASEEPTPSAKVKKLYDIHSSDLYYILASDNLHCDSENEAFKCLYKYAALRGIRNIEKIDPLVDAIRFQYVEAAKLFSMARDHEVIRSCPSFRKKFIAEIKRRSIPNPPSIEDPRKFYKTEAKKNKPLMEELWDWMLNSKHHSGYDKKIESMKKSMEQYKQAQLRKEAMHVSQEKELLREVDRLMAAERNLKVEPIKRTHNENYNPNRTQKINKETTDYCVIL